VGDCAEEILERIAGTGFLPQSLSSRMSDSGDLAATKKAVESWWAEAQKKVAK
jgi:hypothetical protein